MTVTGICRSRMGAIYAPVRVRVSVDRKGKTLGLYAEEDRLGIQVNLEGLEELILPVWESDDAG